MAQIGILHSHSQHLIKLYVSLFSPVRETHKTSIKHNAHGFGLILHFWAKFAVVLEYRNFPNLSNLVVNLNPVCVICYWTTFENTSYRFQPLKY